VTRRPVPEPGPAAVGGTGASGDEPAGPPDVIRAVPVRHLGRWLAALVVAVGVAMLVHSLVSNSRFQWGVVGDYLFSEPILRGVWATAYLTATAMAIGIVGGLVLAVMRLSPNPLLAGAAWFYTWFFRGTPVLVQLLFWSFISALYPVLSIGIPFGPELVHGSANQFISLFTAAILGLGLNEAAYMAEIVRAGILSVDPGQAEAANALGMTGWTTMRRIVLPQAMRVIIPPTGNETISMLKTTSLVSVISYTELLYAAQVVYSRTYQTIPLLLVASVWYLALTSVLTIGQYYLERRFGRGVAARSATPLQRLQAVLGSRVRRGVA
jgi:polar amino acid transport system permease protein